MREESQQSEFLGELCPETAAVTRQLVEAPARVLQATSGQQALWYAASAAPESPAFNVVYAAEVLSPVDSRTLRRALQSMVDRYPALRTTFVARRDGVQRVVHPSAEAPFRVTEGSGWSPATVEQRLRELVHQRFDLERGPLFQLHLLLGAGGSNILVAAFHHIITDLWSMALFTREVQQLYKALWNQAPMVFTCNEDCLEEDQSNSVSADSEYVDSQYWKQQLGGDEIPLLELPTDFKRPIALSGRAGAYTVTFPAEVVDRLRAISRQSRTKLFTTCLAAFQVLLHRDSGQKDIVVGTPKAGRNRKNSRDLGYYVNPIPIRSRIHPHARFSEVLDQARDTLREGFEHGDYPFLRMVQGLKRPLDPGRHPLFQVCLAWQKTTQLLSKDFTGFALNQCDATLEAEALPLRSFALKTRVTPMDLVLNMGESTSGLSATVEYSEDLFEVSTIERMMRHYGQLLAAIADDPEQRICDLKLLTDDELHNELERWNATDRPFRDGWLIHELFEERAAKRPDDAAVVSDAGSVSYGQLNCRANHLARHLRRLGCGPERLVAIGMGRSIDMIVAVLATLKAGGAYVPIDPDYPLERIQFMLDDVRPTIVLTHSDLVEKFAAAKGAEFVCLDSARDQISREHDTNLSTTATADNLAYIIFTSGSTGEPKGVMIPHRGLCNFAEAFATGFGAAEGGRVLQFSSFSFDAAVLEIFTTLCAGATLYLGPRDRIWSAQELVERLRTNRINAVLLPPSVLSILPGDELPDLATVTSGGEACSWELAERWTVGRRFVNAYGPTETTIAPTFYEVAAGRRTAQTVPIGKPISNMRVYLLDSNMRPVPVGVTGQLYIGGVGVARGYFARPVLTADKFSPDPFSKEPGGRLYRTGDLGRRLPSGDIEYVGRADEQVKLRGYRIELGEIESVLRRHPSVTDAVVLVDGDGADRRLLAYVVFSAEANHRRPVPEIGKWVRQYLPAYMAPADVVVLESFPLTPNGKLDRKALARMKGGVKPSAARRVGPKTEVERKVASVWRELLGLEQIGRDEQFFELGGHSLMLVQLHRRLEEEFGLTIPVTELFHRPSIATQAEFLGQPGGAPVASQKQTALLQREAMEARMRRRAVQKPGAAHAGK